MSHRRVPLSGMPTAELGTLPPDLLLSIFSLLSAQDLAAMSMQDAYLRRVAAATELWEPLARARWPGADPARQYGGDWHALFVARAPMPHAFPLAADRVRAVTAAQQAQARQGGAGPARGMGARVESVGGAPAGGLAHLAFDDVMLQTFAAGLAASRQPIIRRSAEWRDLKADLTWWATQRAEVVVAFVRGMHEALACGVRGGWRRGQDTAWRRSAVAFLQDLGLLVGAHASVVHRVAAEAAALDRAIAASERHESSGGAAAPHGLPATHWWFART